MVHHIYIIYVKYSIKVCIYVNFLKNNVKKINFESLKMGVEILVSVLHISKFLIFCYKLVFSDQ